MVRSRAQTDTRRSHALTSAVNLGILVGALIGVTAHDAGHAFDEGDVPCAVCLHTERTDGAVTIAPSIRTTRSPEVMADARRAAAVVSTRIAKEHRPRAPPCVG